VRATVHLNHSLPLSRAAQGEVEAFVLSVNVSSDVVIGVVGTAAAPRLSAQLRYDHATFNVARTAIGPLPDLFLVEVGVRPLQYATHCEHYWEGLSRAWCNAKCKYVRS